MSKKHRVTFRLPADLHDLLKGRAERHGSNVNEEAIRAIRAGLSGGIDYDRIAEIVNQKVG